MSCFFFFKKNDTWCHQKELEFMSEDWPVTSFFNLSVAQTQKVVYGGGRMTHDRSFGAKLVVNRQDQLGSWLFQGQPRSLTLDNLGWPQIIVLGWNVLRVILGDDYKYDMQSPKYVASSFIFWPPESYALRIYFTFDLSWTFLATTRGKKLYYWTPQAMTLFLSGFSTSKSL